MVKKQFLRKTLTAVGCTLLVFLMIIAPVSSVYAIDEATLRRFAQSNILFYDPTGGLSSCGTTLVGGYNGSSSAGLSDLQSAFVDMYHDIAESLSIEYGIPWETVVAQGILESASGTSKFAVERNNFFGIAAYDSNTNAARTYATPEEGWRGYYENIKKTATYRNHGVFAGDAITDPYAYARAIKEAGYATDSKYVEKLSRLISAIENRSAENGWKSSAQLAVSYPEMLQNAAANAVGGAGSGASTSYVANCTYASGNGDINETAINLSWPNRGHSPTDPIPAYREALLASNGVGALGQGDICSIGGYSCDAFLATVMRYSGADAGFPCCGAANQMRYLIANSRNGGMYEEIPNIGNTSNLQPGDIRAKSTHVEIVVLVDGTYKIASASHCDRTADHGINYYTDSSYRIFRRK